MDISRPEIQTMMMNADAFDAMRENLLASIPGQWAVIFDQRLAGTYPTFEAAYRDSVTRFGFNSGSCIEQIVPTLDSYNLNAELGVY